MIRPLVCQHCSVNNPDACETCIMCQHPLNDHKGLFLHEELLLLALDDESGAVTTKAGFAWKYALAGGLLTELLLAEHLHLDDRGKEPLVQVVRGVRPRLDDELHQEVYELIRDHGKPRKLTEWITKVAGLKDLYVRMALPLCELGVLENRAKEHKFLFFRYTSHHYPLLDPTAEYAAIDRCRRAIFAADQPVDERTTLLVALANAGSLLGIRFASDQLKQHKERIDNMTVDSEVGEAVKRTVIAIQTAITVATTAAATSASFAAAT